MAVEAAPILRQESAVSGLEGLILPGPRAWGEDHELDSVDVPLLREFEGIADGLGRVFIGADDEHGVDLDAVTVEALDGLLDLLDGLALAVEFEGFRVDGLEADEDAVAVGFAHEGEHLGVAGGLVADLGAPAETDVSVDHAAHDVLGPLRVEVEDVVREEKERDAVPRVVILEVLEDALDGHGPVVASVEVGDGAEAAVEGAAPGSGDAEDGEVLASADESIVGNGESVEVPGEGPVRVMHFPTAVVVGKPRDGREIPAVLDCLEEFGERFLGLAADDEVGVIQALVGFVGGVGAPEDGDSPGFTRRAAPLIGARGGARYGGDADNVGFPEFRLVHRGDLLDIDVHVVAPVAKDGAEDEAPEAGDGDPGVDVKTGCFGLDQDDSSHWIYLPPPDTAPTPGNGCRRHNVPFERFPEREQ